MARTRLLTMAMAGALALAACSEQQQQKTPTGPEFRPAPSGACDFSQISFLINSYFSPPVQQMVQDTLALMQAAEPQSEISVQKGFSIMRLIGQASRDGTPSATVGSNLTKALTGCMFDTSTDEYLGLSTARFDLALTKATGGVYYEKGGAESATDNRAIVALDYVTTPASPAPISALGLGTGFWSSVLANNTANNQGGRALIYGYPVSGHPVNNDPIVYEWAMIPPNTKFDPSALVSICENSTETQLVHESSVGALAFNTVNLCNEPQTETMLENGWGPRGLAFRLASWTRHLVGSEPTHTAPVYVPDKTGTITGLKSKLSHGTLTSPLALEWIQKPPSTMYLSKMPYPFIVRLTTTINGVKTGVNGGCLEATGFNNNGTKTSLTGSTDCLPLQDSRDISAITKSDPATGLAGYATFSISVTKAGGLIVQVFGQSIQGTTVAFGDPIQSKTKVNP